MEYNAVLQQVAELPELSTVELRKLWKELYKSQPPLYNKASMVSRLAYRIQELHFGGLSTATRKQLAQMVKGQKVERRAEPERPVTGTRWSGPAFFGLKRTKVKK